MGTYANNPIHILFADDDSDDREFFQDALSKSKLNATLTMVEDENKLFKYYFP